MSPKKDRLPGFPERLTAYREATGLTMEALAERVGTRKAAVGHWESGIREPGLVMLCRVCDVLGVTVDRMLGRKPKRKP